MALQWAQSLKWAAMDGTKLRAHVIVEIIRNLPPDFFAVDSMGFLVKSQLLLFVDQYLIRALCSITTVEPSRIPALFYMLRQSQAPAHRAAQEDRRTGSQFLLQRFLGAVAYREKGMFAESVAEYQRLQRVTGGHLFSGLAITYARMGKTTEARTILREFLELSKRKYVSPEQIALIAHCCSTRASDAVTVLANC